MSNIEWGPERECTGEQPCSGWVLVQIKRDTGDWSNLLPAKNVGWSRAVEYRLPAEYEALIAAKEPTHEQMREALAERYEGMPDALVEIDPVADAYNKLRLAPKWQELYNSQRDDFRSMFKAGQEHGK